MKHTQRIFFIWLFITGSQLGFSQSKMMRFEHLNTESGLPRNQVLDLLQDHVGYIWSATGEGLSRYDGYRFKTYNNKTSNLIGNNVFAIYEDKKHKLWVATDKGVSQFNRKTKSFENFGVIDTLTKEKRSFNGTNIFEDSNQRLWIGSRKGLYLFERKQKRLNKNWSNHKLKSIIDESDITAVFQDSSNRLWVSTFSKGVFLMLYNSENKIEEIYNYTYDENDITTICHNRVESVKEDLNKVIWFATRNGLCKLNKTVDVGHNKYTFHKIKNLHQTNQTYVDMLMGITIDSNNNLFIGYLNGIYYLPNGSDTLVNVDIITNYPLLKHNYKMNPEFIDKTGVLWMSSSNGIYKHDIGQLKFKTHRADQSTSESGRQNLTWSILKDQEGQVWVGTSYGLNKLTWSEREKKYDYIHISNITEENSKFNNTSITEIFELDKDNLLISKRSGLYKFNKINLTYSRISLPDKARPGKICKGKNGDLWISTNKGIVKYNPETKQKKRYNLPSGKGKENNNWTHVVYMDKKDRLWVGTNSGINFFLPEEEKGCFIKTNSTSDYKSVWAINSTKDGNIWFGKWGDGLACIIPKGSKLNLTDGYEIEEYHIENGLANEYVYSILPDENENLWMSTNMGLSKLNFKTKLFENYTDEEGLQSNEFNSGAYFKAKDGELFFGGPSGINSFYPSTIFKNNTIPNVVITSVLVNGKERVVTETEKIILKHDQSHLKFEFSALSYNKSSKNSYKIQLENFDKDWVEIGSNTNIRYPKLPPGKYSFKVKGANHNGSWNENNTVINLLIKPPYWKTWWFYVINALFLFGIAYVIFRISVKQVKLKERNEYFEKQNEEKKAVIKEIHHRIKNNLQMVISLLRLQSSKIKDNEVVDMFKETQQRILSMALLHEKMQQDDDIEGIDVPEYFKSLIKNLVKSYAIGKDINLKIDIHKIDLGMEMLTPLSLIVNELITNSLKYAFVNQNNGEISVSLRELASGEYELIVADNGVGYILSEILEGLGTKLIHIFTRQLNGVMEKMDQSGTVYKLIFKKNA